MLLAGLFVMLMSFLSRVILRFQSQYSTTGEGLNLKMSAFVGTGEGFGSAIEVEVTVEGGECWNNGFDHGETEEFWSSIWRNSSWNYESNSTDVEVVSGATYTSTGIREAV